VGRVGWIAAQPGAMSFEYPMAVLQGWIPTLLASAEHVGGGLDETLAFLETELERVLDFVRAQRRARTKPAVPETPIELVPETPPRGTIARMTTPPRSPSSVASAQIPDEIPASPNYFSD